MYVPKISTLYDPKLCASVTETARQITRELDRTWRSLENANVVSIVANGDTFRTSSHRQAEMMMQVKYGHKWKIGSELSDYVKSLQMLGLAEGIYQRRRLVRYRPKHLELL